MTADQTVRRVITAQTREGRSVFAIDEWVEPIVVGPDGLDGRGDHAGQRLWQIWGADGVPQLPDPAEENYANTLFAPPGGYRVQVCEFPAEGAVPTASQGAWPANGTASARIGDGLHHTDSVDIMVVLDGEIGLEQDDGITVTLTKGDVLVQNGAAHRWRKTSVPCRICMIALGAVRSANS